MQTFKHLFFTKKIFTFYILLVATTFLFSQNVKKITFYYIPWNFHERGVISTEDIRNFNDGKNTIYVLTEHLEIQNFISIYKYVKSTPIFSVSIFDVRMVVDIESDNGAIETLLFNKKQQMIVNDTIYYRKEELSKWFEECLPGAK